jgi:hypothetical protein
MRTVTATVTATVCRERHRRQAGGEAAHQTLHRREPAAAADLGAQRWHAKHGGVAHDHLDYGTGDELR